MDWNITRGTATYSLSDKNPYRLLNADGIGAVPIRRLEEHGPQQDGYTDIGYRLDGRVVNLVVGFTGADAAALDAARDTLAGVFAPGTAALVLSCTRADAAVRSLAVHATGLVDFPATSNEWANVWQRAAVQLRAADPVWYDPSAETATIDADPLTITIAYAGNYQEFPIITLLGPLENPVLTNTTTGDVLDFTNYTVTAGVTVTIDLRYGYKTIADSTPANQIDKLKDNSDLATWGLIPGDNSITLAATGMDGNSLVTLTYYNRYTSI